MKLGRREFLIGSAAAAGLMFIPFKNSIGNKNSRYLFLALPRIGNNEFTSDGFLVTGDGEQFKRLIMPGLASHSFLQDPEKQDHIVLIPKGPDTAGVFHTTQNKMYLSFKAAEGFVFWGHGVFHESKIFLSEINRSEKKGIISVRNNTDYKLERVLDSLGYAHECRRDVKDQSLIVAGIHFLQKAEYRHSYSSLRWLDDKSGKLIAVSPLNDPDMTVAHFEQSEDQKIIASSFYKDTVNSGPGFVYFGESGSELKRGKAPREIEERMHGQAVGIAGHFNQNIAVSTHPLSNLICLWDIGKKELIKTFNVHGPMGCVLSNDKKYFTICGRSRFYSIDLKNLEIDGGTAHSGSNISSHMLKLI